MLPWLAQLLKAIHSIIKIESTIKSAWGYYAAMLTIFMGVIGVIYWRLSNMKETKRNFCPYGCLTPCMAYYFQEIKTKLMEPKAVSYFFCWKTVHFSCLALSCWFGFFGECTELKHCVCRFFYSVREALYMYVYGYAHVEGL